MGKRVRASAGSAREAAEAADMDIDAFLDGGFQILGAEATAPSAKSPAKGKTKANGKAAKRAKQDQPDGKPDAGAAPAQLLSTVKSHKAQLEALKSADPEFYKYLAESDQTLLEFEDDEDLDDGTEEAGEGEGDRADADMDLDPEPTTSEAIPSGRLDTALVERWCKGAAEDASLGAIKRVMQAFRAACHYGDQADQDDDSALQIMSDAAFQRILVFTLREADSFFRRLLGLVGRTTVTDADFKSSKWRKASALVKSYLGNALHLLAHLAEEHTSTLILRRLRASLILLHPFESLRKKYLKLVLGLFGTSRSKRVRIQALLWLREYALALGRAGVDAVLKGAYRTFAAHARFVSAAALPDINFMVAGVVELYGLHVGASYEHAFGFIAQLAVLVRNALTMKTVEAYREVYSWKAVNCLELWGRVLAAHADAAALRPLVYPVTQLLLGAARLVPSPRWFPVRLRLVRILNGLAAATGHYVPTAPLLLEVLSWADLAKPARGTGPCPDLLLLLRLSKANLKQPAVQQELVEQTLELLAGSLALFCKSPGFPELVHLPILALRKFIKASPVDRFRSQAQLLLDAVVANAKHIGLLRDAAEFAPKDVTEVTAFMGSVDKARAPLLAYAHRLAEKAAEKRAAATASGAAVKADAGADSSGEDDDMADDLDLLPKKKQKPASKARAEAVDETAALEEELEEEEKEQDEGEEEAEILGMDEDDMPEEDDLLEEYQLSESDEDDDGEADMQQVVHAKARKTKGGASKPRAGMAAQAAAKPAKKGNKAGAKGKSQHAGKAKRNRH